MWLSGHIIALCWIQSGLAARILGVFPVPSISHQVVFRALTLELARRGHELVVFTPDPARHHPNITEIDAHDVSYLLWEAQVMSRIFEEERNGRRSALSNYKIFQDFGKVLFEAHMSLTEVQHLIKSESESFDLILVESLARPYFAFRHKYKVPLIAVSSFAGMVFTYDSIGIPSHPILYPDVNSKIKHANIFEKTVAVCEYLYKYFDDSLALKRINEDVRKVFGEDTPDIAELEAKTDMLFLNVNPIWDGIKATPPNVYYMWGSHLKPEKELPLDLKKFLDSSPNGVVYMSLGSNMKSTELSADRLRVFVETFRRLPYRVLWKWEADELPGKPDNVRIENWLPQADLLKHRNIKAFITQGGVQSTDEALMAGVPMIGIPMFGDQETNVQRYEKHGVGVSLNLKTLTVKELEETINSIVHSRKYREAILRLSRLLADGGVAGGVERAAWWVEYVIRHGGAQHLRSPAAGVSAIEYFMLDVVAVVLLATLLGFIFIATAVYIVYYLLLSRNRQMPKVKSQ